MLRFLVIQFQTIDNCLLIHVISPAQLFVTAELTLFVQEFGHFLVTELCCKNGTMQRIKHSLANYSRQQCTGTIQTLRIYGIRGIFITVAADILSYYNAFRTHLTACKSIKPHITNSISIQFNFR